MIRLLICFRALICYSISVFIGLPLGFYYVGMWDIFREDETSAVTYIFAGYLISSPAFFFALIPLLAFPRFVMSTLGWWCFLAPFVIAICWTILMSYILGSFDVPPEEIEDEVKMGGIISFMAFVCAAIGSKLFHSWDKKDPIWPGERI